MIAFACGRQENPSSEQKDFILSLPNGGEKTFTYHIASLVDNKYYVYALTEDKIDRDDVIRMGFTFDEASIVGREISVNDFYLGPYSQNALSGYAVTSGQIVLKEKTVDFFVLRFVDVRVTTSLGEYRLDGDLPFTFVK
jgi:hypothetical protein